MSPSPSEGSAAERVLIVSADCHAGLRPGGYRSYLDPAYREAFDRALPIQLEMTRKLQAKTLNADFKDDWKTGEVAAGVTGAWDSAERDRQLDGDGIAAEVIFPDGVTDMNAPPFGASFALPFEEPIVPELQWAGARAHNRWLAEFVAESPARRAGLALVPLLWGVDDAVAEIRWAHENGLKGIIIPPRFGSQHEPYHSLAYDPVWAACADLGMPIHTHGGNAPDYGWERTGTVGIFITEVHWWSARPLWFLLWGGAFERHPKLRFVVTELGASWVPELKALMDQRFSDTHFSKKLGSYRDHLSMKPSEYFDRNCWIGASVTSPSDIAARHAIGVSNLMWGSDYPHPEGSWPHTARFLDESFRGVPEDEARAMLGGNAAEVYGLDRAALAPVVARIGPEAAALGLTAGP